MVKDQAQLPPSLEKPVTFINDYLSSLKDTCNENHKHIMRYQKAAATRRFNEAKITVESKDKRKIEPDCKVFVCKGVEPESSLIESNITRETIVYQVLQCPGCTYKWKWKMNKDRYQVTCPRCHKTFTLFWK